MNRKWNWMFVVLLVAVAGCAHVQVEAPKDPIKMDISMRLDVYQHVVKDIDDIEAAVAGKKPAQVALAEFFVTTAFAQEGLGPDAEQAIERRRDRHSEVVSLISQGVLIEGDRGLLVARGGGHAQASQVMENENGDRMIIYRAMAVKHGSSVEDIQKVYAERLKTKR